MMRLVRAPVYSNVFVAVILTCLTASSYSIVDSLKEHWYVPVSVFLGSFVLYTFHRLYKIDFIPKDQLAERHAWVLRYANPLKYAMSFAVFVQLLILPNFDADAIVWVIPAAIISAGYTIPLLPTSNGWQRFRDIPLAKPLIISIVASYLTFGFPVFEQWGMQALFTKSMFPLFAERMLFLLAVTIPFDLRDITNDQQAGLNTLATEFGFHRGRQIGLIVTVVWFAQSCYLSFQMENALQMLVTYVALFALVLLAYAKMKESWKELRYTLVFEGLILLYSVALILFSRFHSMA
jgi:4-hydroxybenzoate polyprenyltransferase